MKIKRIAIFGLLLMLSLSLVAGPAWADRRPRRDDPRSGKHYKERGYVLDKRYSHNRYYPPRRAVVKALPRGYRVIPHHRSDYYFYGGVWYRPSGSYFSVVVPPIGLIVPILPHFYTTIWVGGLPYYYAADTYYTWHPRERGYIVTAPPPASAVIEEPEVPSPLYIYPKLGQSEQQQATDRYECHRWSVDQTGFDPTQPGGNVPAAENESRRADYQRAMKACLEARDYSVQ